jgi:hypothetical protein
MGLVKAAARKHGWGYEDAVQTGALELLERLYGRPDKRTGREITTYDPDRGVKFWTFAEPYVTAAMRTPIRPEDPLPEPEGEEYVPEPLRDPSPEDEMDQRLREEEIELVHERALQAVDALPDLERAVFLSAKMGAVPPDVFDRQWKTALQRATRTLARDGRVRRLKFLVGYETTQDLRAQQERSQRILASLPPAPAARPPLPYPGRPAYTFEVFPGMRVRPVQVWRGTPTEKPRRKRFFRPVEKKCVRSEIEPIIYVEGETSEPIQEDRTRKRGEQ